MKNWMAKKPRIMCTAVERKALLVVLLAGMIIKTFYSAEIPSLVRTNLGVEVCDDFSDHDFVDDSLPGYRDYIAEYEGEFLEQEIRAEAENCTRYEENDAAAEPLVYTDYEGMPGACIYTAEGSLVEFTVNVEQEGFYNLALEYYPTVGKDSEIERCILIDGKIPYREMAHVEYPCIWEPDSCTGAEETDGSVRYPQTKDDRRNGRSPEMVETPGWITSYAFDSEGYIAEPLSVYMTEGVHTISIRALEEAVLIRQIILNNAGQIKDYEQVKAFWDAVGIKAASGQTVRINAENIARTSSKHLVPTKEKGQIFQAAFTAGSKETFNNVIDGSSWNQAGQWIEWEFDVEEAGYYNISIYDRQNYMKGTEVYRKIMIDGTVPFKEMEGYGFEYGQKWKTDVFLDDTGEPYVFYLKKGHHTIRMEAVLGGMGDILCNVAESVRKLDGIYQEIADRNGIDPEGQRACQTRGLCMDLKDELTAIRDVLDESIADLQELPGKHSDGLKTLITMKRQIDVMIKGEECQIREMRAFRAGICACSAWVNDAASQPLAIGRIDIVPSDILNRDKNFVDKFIRLY